MNGKLILIRVENIVWVHIDIDVMIPTGIQISNGIRLLPIARLRIGGREGMKTSHRVGRL